MTVLGFWVTVLALVTSLVASLNYYRNANHQRFLLYPARVWMKLSVASILAASALLLALIINHDFANGYVYSYSDRSLPFFLLASTFWAGQEGSFLFWALCSSLIALWLSPFTAKRKTEPYVMGVFMALQSFLLLLLVVKTPFIHLWEMFPDAAVGHMPPDGSGLNPLLQNFWMVIHPPVLFVGFAAMSVPFSFAVAGLWRKDYQEWILQAFPWVLFASVSLGMGLIIGAYWAYGVLGWGGYWGWDPVENSSLVPWITSVALIHTLLAQRRSGKFVRTNLFLAIISYFLVVYSTFLTRSGVLGDSSVHSFADPGMFVYSLLVMYLAFIAALGLGMMAARRKELRPENGETAFISRETALGAGMIILLISAAVVLFGTSLPIVSKTTVEPSFYDRTHLPIGIAIGLLIGFSLFVQWGIDEWKSMLKRSMMSLLASVVVTAVLWFIGVRDWMFALFAFSATFAFFVNIETGARTMNGNVLLLGGKFAHLGLALMFLGIIATGKYSSSQHLSLPLNQPQQVLGYTMTYTGYHPTGDGKFAFHVAAEKDGKTFLLDPVMFDAGQQGLMRNPDIVSFLTKDVYVSPVSLQQDDAHASHTHDTYTMPKGETVVWGDVKAKFVKFDMNDHSQEGMAASSQGMTIGSVLELTNGSARETVVPAMHYSGNGEPHYTSTPSKLVNGEIQLVSLNVGMGTEPSTITVTLHRDGESESSTPETLVVEASIKPYINLLWGGTVIMTLGFFIAMFKRLKEA
ncbi:MAG: cytochrome c biogenesis protein CcsA [Bacteroidetes bacterium]|nr:cytochrome c biogenesis protein CcsA [Bacteroidota bacterium]MCW5895523.1 cytochrome c biogenesis protein CcsA [Bacteroidota bacterium]